MCILYDEWCEAKENKNVCWWVCIKSMHGPRVSDPGTKIQMSIMKTKRKF